MRNPDAQLTSLVACQQAIWRRRTQDQDWRRKGLKCRGRLGSPAIVHLLVLIFYCYFAFAAAF